MTLRHVNIEWKHAKTYATEAAPMRRIDQDKGLYPDHDDRFIVVRTPEGRWTATVILDKQNDGYIGRYEFMKV